MTNPLSNPSYLLPPLVALVASLVLLAVVWQGGRKSFSSVLFSGFLLSVGLWGFLLFGMRSSPDVHRALLWERALPVTTYTTFVLFYHFTLAYTNNRGQRGILLVSYLFLVAVAALSPTELLIERMRLEDYGYAPVVSSAAFPITMSIPLLMGGGAYNFIRRYKASSSYEERNRLFYLIIAVLFPLLGLFLDAFTNLPPAAIWGNLIFCIMCTVAILKYHLLDVRIIIRKSLVYLLISIVVGVPYVGLLYSLHYVFKSALELWWIHALIILLLAIILRPLYSRAQHLVDRLFYRDRYDSLKALQQFSHQTQSVADLNELGSSLIQLVRGALRSSSACLLLPSEGEGGLVMVCSSGLESPPPGVVLKDSSPLVKWLRVHGDILSSEQLNIVPQLQSFSLKEKNNLEQMEAKLYVPIKIRPSQLSGILVLGQKLSQQFYSNEDRQLLITLSSQMAMVLENARLYSEVLRARKDLESWLNSMTDCVMIVSTDYTIQFMNRAGVEKFGSRTGTTCWDTLGKQAACSFCPMQHSRRNDRGGTHFISNVRDREYDGAVAPLLEPDGSLSIIEVLRDITDRRRAEEREKRLQEELSLSSRLASIGELAAGVAHELNNPLTGILGFSERLLRKSANEEISQDLERIRNEGLRAAKVVQNLLTFARPREPKMEYSDISDILQKALELRAYELRTSNIEVITDLAPSLPKVVVDFGQVQEVFLNIILNAEQAMTEAHKGGKLRIKTQHVKGHIGVSFADDGPGILAGHLDKVFDPFFSTRAERGGTGLGLSVCHGIVTGHGGRIYAKSKPGEGATFFVELPIMSEVPNKDKVVEEETMH